MKVGDLVRYRGWNNSCLPDAAPIGIVVDMQGTDPSDFHTRIRVTWSGSELPIQSKVLSVNGSRTTRWVHPKHFEIITDS